MGCAMPGRVYGVDFSGAWDAGRRIWLARGVVDGGRLRIEACCRAEDLPVGGRRRDEALTALRAFIAGADAAVFGLDFPFGLPSRLVDAGSWDAFVLGFGERYASPEAFRDACRARAEGRELRRLTDSETKTPFSPYNLRLYRQTYYGVRDLLAPLVRTGAVAAVPMQAAAPDRPWLLETCPATTLKRLGLYAAHMSYKGRTPAHRANRERILAGIEAEGALLVQDDVRQTVCDDRGGDALDSLIAAWATFLALRAPDFPGDDRTGCYAREGRVYT